MSFSRPSKLAKWAQDQKFAYELWSDKSRVLAIHYDASSTRLAPLPSRVTRLLDNQGNVLLEYSDGLDVGTHPQDVLDDCLLLFGASEDPTAEGRGQR